MRMRRALRYPDAPITLVAYMLAPSMRTIPLFPFLLLPLWAACQSGPVRGGATGEEVTPEQVEERSLAAVLQAGRIDPASIRFHVDKSDRTFTVLAGDSVLKHYPCVLGEKPVGDKFHQGDRKTPEGDFTFRSKRVHAQWHKFIWVDYPNAESYRRYKERKAQGLIPAGKDIGGEIGIHGVPDGMDHWIQAGQDWTWGCIALRNADVDEIYPYIIPSRTRMTVVP